MAVIVRLGALVAAVFLVGCADKMRGYSGSTSAAAGASADQTVLGVDDRFRDALRPELVATGRQITHAKFEKIVQASDGSVRACGRYTYVDDLGRKVLATFGMVGRLNARAFVPEQVEVKSTSAAAIICRQT